MKLEDFKHFHILRWTLLVMFILASASVGYFCLVNKISKNYIFQDVERKQKESQESDINIKEDWVQYENAKKVYSNDNFGFSFTYIGELKSRVINDEPLDLQIQFGDENLSCLILINNNGVGFENYSVPVKDATDYMTGIRVDGINTDIYVFDEDSRFIDNPERAVFVEFETKSDYFILFTYLKNGPNQLERIKLILKTLNFNESALLKTYKDEKFGFEFEYNYNLEVDNLEQDKELKYLSVTDPRGEGMDSVFYDYWLAILEDKKGSFESWVIDNEYSIEKKYGMKINGYEWEFVNLYYSGEKTFIPLHTIAAVIKKNSYIYIWYMYSIESYDQDNLEYVVKNFRFN